MNVTVVVAEKVLEFKMYLATVTCHRDFQQMLLQAESIGKFLEPCTHVILINEDEPNIEFWYKWLTPYYRNHNLVIIPKFPIKRFHSVTGDKMYGWATQQLQKFLIGIIYNRDEDYILLDSKNFFVKPTKLSDFQDILGSGKLIDIKEGVFEHTNNYYANYFNVNPLSKSLSWTTPFVIQPKYLSRFTESQLEDVLLHGTNLTGPKLGHSIMPCEFLFYSYLIDDLPSTNNSIHTHRIIWEHDINSLEYMLYQNNSDVKVYGFCRKLLSRLYPSGVDFVNDWLNNHIGLKNKIVPMPIDF